MKKHLLSILLFCGLATGFSSCEKEVSDETPTVNPPSSTANLFSAKIDGASFSGNILNSSMIGTNISIVSVFSTSNKAMSVLVPSAASPGSYDTSASGDFRIGYINGTGQNNSYSARDNGSIVILSNDVENGIMKGTFSGILTNGTTGPEQDTLTVTEGKFTVNY